MDWTVPIRKYEYGGAKAGYKQPLSNGRVRSPRNLGNNDITKLLDDLDNQTEAIKSGQEIGDELLSGKNQTWTEGENLGKKNNSSTTGMRGPTLLCLPNVWGVGKLGASLFN